MLKLIKKSLKNEKGLTLVELLVVVVILGIISSIAVVSIGNIIGETKDKAKVTEAVQIINAAKLAHTTDGKLPADGKWDSTDLENYVTNVKAEGWNVTWNGNTKKYSITGHEAAAVKGIDMKSRQAVSEDVLTKYLSKEE